MGELDPERRTRLGDLASVHLAIFDAEGRLLYSTRASDRAEMEQVKASFDGDYVLPPRAEDAPQGFAVTDGLRPFSLFNGTLVAVGSALLDKPVGTAVAVPLLGRPTGFEEEIRLLRERGPFNRTVSVGTSTFLNMSEDDETLALDDAVRARLIERGADVSRVRFEVEDGQVVPIRQTPLRATVDVDEAADTFRLLLDATPGDRFSLLEACRFAQYVLPLGTYRVEEVTEEEIVLSVSPVQWPQLIGRELVMIMEVVKIEEMEDQP